jgi:hypothetical protein
MALWNQIPFGTWMCFVCVHVSLFRQKPCVRLVHYTRSATKCLSTGFWNLEVTDLALSCPLSTIEFNGKIKHVGPLGIARIVHMHGSLLNIHVSCNSTFNTQVSSHQYNLCVVYFYLIWLLITIWQPVIEKNSKVTIKLTYVQRIRSFMTKLLHVME